MTTILSHFKILIVLIFLCSCSWVQPYSDPTFTANQKKVLWQIINAADFLTTSHDLHNGQQEINPLWGGDNPSDEELFLWWLGISTIHWLATDYVFTDQRSKHLWLDGTIAIKGLTTVITITQ